MLVIEQIGRTSVPCIACLRMVRLPYFVVVKGAFRVESPCTIIRRWWRTNFVNGVRGMSGPKPSSLASRCPRIKSEFRNLFSYKNVISLLSFVWRAPNACKKADGRGGLALHVFGIFWSQGAVLWIGRLASGSVADGRNFRSPACRLSGRTSWGLDPFEPLTPRAEKQGLAK